MLAQLFVIAALQAAAPAEAAPSQPAPAPAAAAPAAKAQPTPTAGDEVVCRMEPVTGSRFPVKMCRRKSDIAQRTRDDQARLNQEQRMGFNCHTSGVGC